MRCAALGVVPLNADHVLLILTHLNAPYGPVLQLEQLQAAIRAGSLEVIGDHRAHAIAAAIFIECSAQSIMAAAQELGVGPKDLKALYQSCVASGSPSHPEWERFFRELD